VHVSLTGLCFFQCFGIDHGLSSLWVSTLPGTDQSDCKAYQKLRHPHCKDDTSDHEEDHLVLLNHAHNTESFLFLIVFEATRRFDDDRIRKHGHGAGFRRQPAQSKGPDLNGVRSIVSFDRNLVLATSQLASDASAAKFELQIAYAWKGEGPVLDRQHVASACYVVTGIIAFFISESIAHGQQNSAYIMKAPSARMNARPDAPPSRTTEESGANGKTGAGRSRQSVERACVNTGVGVHLSRRFRGLLGLPPARSTGEM